MNIALDLLMKNENLLKYEKNWPLLFLKSPLPLPGKKSNGALVPTSSKSCVMAWLLSMENSQFLPCLSFHFIRRWSSRTFHQRVLQNVLQNFVFWSSMIHVTTTITSQRITMCDKVLHIKEMWRDRAFLNIVPKKRENFVNLRLYRD